jgi:uncharacterized protein YnzC (UPF0291/DUF896 family)
MEQKKIDRINQLACLARERELTEAEDAERCTLRKEYVDAIKADLQAHLDNTYCVDQAGNKRKLQKKEK